MALSLCCQFLSTGSMNRRAPHDNENKKANGKGKQNHGGKGQGHGPQRADDMERREGQAVPAAAVTPTTRQSRPVQKSMTGLLSNNVVSIENTVKGNTKVQLSEQAQKEVLGNIISPIMRAHDAGEKRTHKINMIMFSGIFIPRTR